METWPLVGRQRELQRLRVALTTETGGAVVAGLPGVGKTRLAREAVEQVRAHAPVVEWVMATQAASRIPFGPVVHLLPVQKHGGGTRLDLLRQISDGLADRAGGGRVVLGVDDAHLLDDASAALVHHLVTTAVAVVALTVRAGAVTADAVSALWKDRYIDWIEIRPFRRAEFDEVLTGVLGAQVEGSTAQQLWTLSQGNALLLRELVSSMQESGVLARRGGMWRISGQVVPDARLADTVWARLGRLSGDLREVAEVVAHGEPIGARLLERIVSEPAFQAAAERADLLEIDRRDDRRTQIRLVHPLYGELLRATTPPLRARLLRRRLAEALERTGARRADDLLRLAVWRLDGGGAADTELFTRAARQASGRFFDHVLAERLASAAVDAGGGWRARRALAEAISAQGRAGEAEALLAELDREASTDERARVAVTRASNLFWGLGRSTEAEQVLLDAGTADSGSLDEPAVLRAIIALSRGRTEGALAIVAPLLDSPDPSRPPSHAYLGATAIATGAWAFAGRAEHAVTTARRTLEAATRDHPVTALPVDRLLTALCIAYRLAGRLSDADELAADRYRDAVGRHAQDLQATWALMLGENALARGDLGVAIPMLRESAGLLSERAWFFGVYSRSWCLGSMSEALALAGETDAAQATLAEADAVGPDEFFIPNRERGRVWAAVARGDIATALAVAEHAAGLATRLGSHLVAADALHDLARLGRAAAVAVPLSDLAIWTESRLVPVYAAHARALSAQDGDALDAVAASFADLGTDLLAGEAAAEASRVHQRGGQRAKAAASAEQAARLVGGTPAPRTPALHAKLPSWQGEGRS